MSMLLLAALAAAAEPRVTELLRAYIHLHDAQGNVIRRVPKNQAPQPPLPIVPERNATGQIGVKFNGQTVYLRNSEVKTEGLSADCAALPAKPRNSASTGARAAEGVSSGLGDGSTSCVRKHP